MDLNDLKRSISLCKEGISAADQNLEKLTGRIANKDNFNNQKPIIKRRINNDTETHEIKKPRTDKETPMLNSVVQMAKGRTRDDALTEMKKRDDPKEKERCRRLFGHLMGTLNSIKKEAEKASSDQQNITRMKIEKKVEESNKMVNETIKKEQEELIKTKKERQNDLKVLNQRYRAAEAFERWKMEKEKMKGYIRTSKSPYIFYLPKVINDETKLRIDQTIRELETMIEMRKKKLAFDIEKAVKMSETHFAPKDILREDIIEKKDEFIVKSETVKVEEKESTKPERKARSNSPANSYASEDYDDMIDEIEISVNEDLQQTESVIHQEEVKYEEIKQGEDTNIELTDCVKVETEAMEVSTQIENVDNIAQTKEQE